MLNDIYNKLNIDKNDFEKILLEKKVTLLKK